MINFILGSLCFILGGAVGIVLMAIGQAEWNKHNEDQSWPPRKDTK